MMYEKKQMFKIEIIWVLKKTGSRMQNKVDIFCVLEMFYWKTFLIKTAFKRMLKITQIETVQWGKCDTKNIKWRKKMESLNHATIFLHICACINTFYYLTLL